MTKLEELVLEYKELKIKEDEMKRFCQHMYERYRIFVGESDRLRDQCSDAYQRMMEYIEDKRK